MFKLLTGLLLISVVFVMFFGLSLFILQKNDYVLMHFSRSNTAVILRYTLHFNKRCRPIFKVIQLGIKGIDFKTNLIA